ncbi:MAG: AAA family ATPase [Bacilli bacterium]|nr:AAA family ATPase [Bacilli bacterium]
MERKITKYLEQWKEKKNKLPLVIKGLRQVGKTYIVKKFAADNYENAFLLDFRKDASLHALFDNDFNIDSLSVLISSLPDANQLIKGSRMIPYKTVLVFDELQDCPNARSSLKYFKEDGRFDVICTGSLLGIDGYRITKKQSRGIAVGSEEQIEMYAMDFEEFLWAMNIDVNLIDILKKSIDEKKPIPEYLHLKFLDLINKYICVGGMPEVVSTFIETNNINESRAVQQRLLNNYRSDFGTHLKDDNKLEIDNVEKSRIMDVFDSIPKQLAKENKKFSYSIIDSKARARTHQDAINWLKNYGLIDVCYNLSTIEQPFDFVANKNEFKIYVADIGLLVAMLEDDIPFKILSNQLGIGKGMIYENLIADALHKLHKPLYYFAKSSGLEIDFISSIFHIPYLVEVKSKNGNTKSAKSVLNNKNYNVDHLLKLSSQNIGLSDTTLTLPYYSSFYILNQ